MSTKPIVWITPDCWDKLITYVKASDVECSMLCEVESSGGRFLINKVYLPKQTRSAAFTKITHEGIVELLTNQDINPAKLKAWFHSHVNMSVTPSSQDVSQAKELMQDAEWFIRGILNKKYEYSLFIHWMGIDIEADLEVAHQLTEDLEQAKAELAAATVTEPITYSKTGYPHGGTYGYNGKKKKGRHDDYYDDGIYGTYDCYGNRKDTYKILQGYDRSYSMGYKEWSILDPSILTEEIYNLWTENKRLLMPLAFRNYVEQEALNISPSYEYIIKNLKMAEWAELYKDYIDLAFDVRPTDLIMVAMLEEFIESRIIAIAEGHAA